MNALLVLCAVLGAAPASDPASAPAAQGVFPIRRFALVAGVNDGGADRVRLRYARSDAERVAHVLERLGGVARADEVLLLDPDEAALRAAFGDLANRIRAARATSRAELVLYYSGHSDEQGFLLRGARVPFDEVRRWLATVGADVRIAIVDSCSSGALTRQKGGNAGPPFLVDTSTLVKGHAILTSSAAEEASQESDRIGASFFTYYLLTGLRGAADASGDGKVTVSEAYQFAFGETLSRTERTASGAQHPAYDIQLAGSGDVVLTDLRGTDAALVFPDRAAGRFFVRDREGRLVAELRKSPGRPVQLGVDPGTYRVVQEDGTRLAALELAVASGARALVQVDGLQPIDRERARVRGGEGELTPVPVDLSVFPPLSLNGDRPARNAFQLGLLGARTTELRGVGLAPALWAGGEVTGVQLGGVWSSAGGAVKGAQLSGSIADAGSLRGAQVGGIWTSSRGPLEGAQLSGAIADAGPLRGAQLGGVWTSARGPLEGAQLAGVAGVMGSGRGVQLAGVWASASGEVEGAQVAGVVADAGSIRGAQLAVVNVAGEVRGLQLGVVNLSRAAGSGWQLGVVNVSRQGAGVPLGLVNVVRDGWHRLLLASDEDGSPALGWAGGTAWFHTTLEASYRRTPAGGEGWASFGPGVHLQRRVGLDVDLLARRAIEAGSEPPYVVLTGRVLVTLPVSSRLGLVAGPTVNVLVARRTSAAVPVAGGAFGELTRGASRAWLGLQAGVRL